MLRHIAILFLITLIPAFELRASIPVGIFSGTLHLPFNFSMSGMGLPWPFVFIICVAANALLGIVLFPMIDTIMRFLERIPVVGQFWMRVVVRAQKRIHPYVERWGPLGVALFVGIPLPGSGSYTGAVGSYLLGMSYRTFIVANTLGVIIAGTAVTVIVLTGSQLFAWAISG